MHSSRKHSEDRRISQCPDLDTISADKYLNIFPNLSTIVTNQETSTSAHDLTNMNKEDDTNKVNVKIVNAHNVTTQTNTDNLVFKKQLLSTLNLTESSSSGSGTDSVCTAFEVQQRKTIGDVKMDKSTNSLKTPESYITKLGGLFQSTNLLMKKTPTKVTESPSKNQPFEAYKYSYKDFSVVDHRLKLYLCQSVFDDENETFKWLVQGRIYDENDDCNNFVGFNGIFLMSTTKFYIFKITADERYIIYWNYIYIYKEV